MVASFIESGFKTKVEYEAWLASGATGVSTGTPITVYYWGPTMMNMYGRAIGIYLTLNQAGVAYEMKGTNEMPGGASFAVPAVVIDGVLIGQTPMILKALGDKLGLAGTTTAEKYAVMHAIEDMNDVFGEHGKWVENAERKGKWLAYLEQKLAGRQWMAGTAEPTVADFHGVFAFEWVVKKGIDFSGYPKVSKWWADIRAYPVVAKMYASCVDGRTMIP